MQDATFSSEVVFPIWPDTAFISENRSPHEQQTYLPLPSDIPPTYLPLPFNINLVRNIVQPTLTAYLPDPSIATGTAVIICPGGVFHFLSIELEGTDVAHWLCAQGIAAFILKYHLVPTEVRDEDFIQQLQQRFTNLRDLMEHMHQIEPLAIADGQQAIKVLRQRAPEWRIVPDRIGILGFSSGGVVAIGAAMNSNLASRPNFAAPIYPSLSGTSIVVPPDAPPLFLLAASDDPMAVGVALPLYSAWRDASHPAELHLYAQGGHGFGMKKQNLPTDHWIDRFHEWLKAQGFLPNHLTNVPEDNQ